jgi:hypothetical protein
VTDVALSALTRPRLLSEQLADLRSRFAETRASLREVLAALEARAFTLLLILLALPFVAPVSVPGSSTPLGLLIATVAVQLAFGRLPWLPRRVLDWRLPAGFFTKVIPVTQRIVQKLERGLHPRWSMLTATPTWRAVHLLTITVAALLLALPILVPLTNTLPGWTILLLGCGLLERDGVFVALGHAMFIATVVFFLLAGSAITTGLLHLWHWVAG